MIRQLFSGKWVKRILLFGFCFAIFLGISLKWVFDPLLGPVYDRLSGQRSVETSDQLEKVLAQFQTISYKELRRTDLARGDDLPSMKHYEQKEYIIISGTQRYKYLIGNQRIYQFLPGLRIWRFRLPRLEHSQYLLIDKAALHQLLMFRHILSQQGLNQNAFVVSSGFRPPTYNKQVGGKPKSRHLHGQAIDILILDINKDGRSDKKDVDLAYTILDQHIVKDRGGLGRYKSNKRLLHLDCRGYQARWHY